jgi:hypothetical protein
LTVGISENTSTVDIHSGSNVNILSPIIENNYDNNDDKKNDISPDHLTGLKQDRITRKILIFWIMIPKLRKPKEPIIY